MKVMGWIKRSPLRRIEKEAMSGDLTKALRLCLSLGGKVKSSSLRSWASTELNGYGKGSKLPDYRIIAAPLMFDGVSGNMRIQGHSLSTLYLPEFAREVVEEVELNQSVPALKAQLAASNGKDKIRFGLPMGADLAAIMNSEGKLNMQIERIYWGAQPSEIFGVLEVIRTKVLAVVAEIKGGLPTGELLPPSELVERSMATVIGNNNVVVGDHSTVKVIRGSRETSWTRIGVLATVVGVVIAVVANWQTLATFVGELFG